MSFSYALNTSTIRERCSDLGTCIDICAEAGYDAIEPWLKQIDAFLAAGGSLSEIRQRCADRGIGIIDLIAFPTWCVDDPAQRAAGIEEARRCFAVAAELGCPMVAMPPMGLIDVPDLDLDAAAERYRTVYDIGQEHGVVALLEFWGPAMSLGRIGEALYVLCEADCPQGCLLADVYHMYKKGTPHSALRRCGPGTVGLVHVNDYPAAPPRSTITDADRVHCGDGVADWATIIGALEAIDYSGHLSVELFNPTYWQQDPLQVATEGLAKIQALVAEHARP